MLRRTIFGIFLCALTGLGCAQNLIKVAEITQDKKDQTVKLSGTINSFRASTRDNVPNSFMLKDETGETRIVIWNDIFNQSPAKTAVKDTAQAEVTGKVAEYRGKLEIHIDSPAGITVKGGANAPAVASAAPLAPAASIAPRTTQAAAEAPVARVAAAAPAAGLTSIATVNESLIDREITVQGKVSSVRTPRNERAPYVVKLSEGAAFIDVVFWADPAAGAPKVPKVGDDVTARGKVIKFHEILQVRLANPNDLKISGSAAATATTAAIAASTPTAPASAPGQVVQINSLSADKNGQTVTIAGMVSSARAPRSETAPFNLKITDDTGTIDVVFWKATADKLSPEQKMNVGDKVQITGQMGDHRGTPQIRVEDPAGIKKTASGGTPGAAAATPGPQTAAPKVPLSQIAALPADSRVEVSGTVASIEELRLGRRIQLRDGAAAAELLLWDSAEGLKPDVRFLRVNSSLHVTAKVAEQQGIKVLTVTLPEDILDFRL